MSKAKENRLNSLAVTFLERQQIIPHPLADQIISAYKEGYNQAEKDLALTIDDIEKIHTFLYAVKNNKQGVFTFTRLSDGQYQEVLKRFKERKENAKVNV